MAASKRYYCRIGGAVGDIGESRFGFRAPDYAYDGIKDELGVVELTDNASARGVLFGANYPKPPKVRLSGKDPQVGDDKPVSAIRYVDPDKIGRVLNGSLADAVCKTASRSFLINTVSPAS